MALINQAKREINAKIVYFGPGLAGKSTNLRHIYGKLKPEFRGNLKGMQVKDARMLFFDFTPPGDSSVAGFKVRIHVYTLSGEVTDPAVWKMVLKGVDGLVFVADSGMERLGDNRAALEQLGNVLTGYGTSLAQLPAVFQYNKRDVEYALPAADLQRALNSGGKPSFEATGQAGEGVIQTLLALVKAVLIELRRKGLEGIAPPESVPSLVEAAEREPVTAPQPAAPELAQPELEPEAEVEPELGLELEPAEAAEVGSRLQELRPYGEELEAADEELSLELAGTGELSEGRLILPLVIRSGARSKTFTLKLTIAEE